MFSCYFFSLFLITEGNYQSVYQMGPGFGNGGWVHFKEVFHGRAQVMRGSSIWLDLVRHAYHRRVD